MNCGTFWLQQESITGVTIGNRELVRKNTANECFATRVIRITFVFKVVSVSEGTFVTHFTE